MDPAIKTELFAAFYEFAAPELAKRAYKQSGPWADQCESSPDTAPYMSTVNFAVV